MTDSIDIIRAAALDGVSHGFLGRTGGVSQGIYASLDVSPGNGDDPQATAENRKLAIEAATPGAELSLVHQIHSPDAVIVTKPLALDRRPEADGMATDRPGIALGILTADCAPVLLADSEAGVIGAAHAGWKGAMTGIVRSTVEKMEDLGAERSRIAAAVGPCIGRGSYEVDDDFRKRFETIEPENEKFFRAGAPGHHYFDLEAYVAAWLDFLGIETAEIVGLDTYANEDRFFSYRRATHKGEPDYGRQLSVIAL
ncbi:MAG: peptidoglycan editing factor PgeF [Parasphingopyxis sp.]|nr:peptidoglycan editing factor PgeF [Sphingomonadales bacterium]